MTASGRDPTDNWNGLSAASAAMRVHDSPDTCLLEVREQAANDFCDVRPTKNPRKMAPSGSFFGQVLLSDKYDLLLVKHQRHPMDIAGIPLSSYMQGLRSIPQVSQRADRTTPNNAERLSILDEFATMALRHGRIR